MEILVVGFMGRLRAFASDAALRRTIEREGGQVLGAPLASSVISPVVDLETGETVWGEPRAVQNIGIEVE